MIPILKKLISLPALIAAPGLPGRSASGLKKQISARQVLLAALLCLALSAPFARAQFQWADHIATSTALPDNELEIGLALDSNDNSYVTGWFDGTNNFGGITLTNQSTGGGTDIFVAKYNAAGALQWAQRAGGTVGNQNTGKGAGIDANGNVYVTGGVYGSANFGGINLPASSLGDFFLAKYDNSGVVQWVRQSAGGVGNICGTGLAVDGAGNSYALLFVDNFQGGATLTFGTTDISIPIQDGLDTILIKYNNAGAVQWAQLLGGAGEVWTTKDAVDAAGNVYVQGTFEQNLTIGNSNLVVNPATATKNGFIAKFNSSGALIWVQQLGGGNVGEGGVAVDPGGDVYVSGAFSGNLNFGSGISLTNTATNAPFGNAFVAKYDSLGVIQWADEAGGTNGGYYFDIALDGQTNIYAAGGLISGAAVSEYSPAGTLQWTCAANGPPANPVGSIVAKCAVDATAHCYVAGWYQGTVTFGSTVLQPQETWNFFAAKITQSLAVATTALPAATTSLPYGQTLAAFGGQSPYTWAITSGALSPGLSLTNNGVLAGTPTSSGTYSFTVKVTDALSATATQTLQLTVSNYTPPNITFSLTPAAVSNTYVGPITLQIGGLTNGETVVVQKFIDLNANGVIDAGDWLVQQFTLTDGQAGMVIGGVTNINVPGDTDGTANGQITATLNFQDGDFSQDVIGNYLYKLSSPVGHFAPVTKSFGVTNFPFPQKITGTVVNNGTSVTVPEAIVLLFPPGANGSPSAGTVANDAGSFTILAPAGTYALTALKSNYLAAFKTAAPVTNGQTAGVTLTMTNASATISGSVFMAGIAGVGLPGVAVSVQSANGLIALAFTDTNGNYSVPVTAGIFAVRPDEGGLLVHGCLGLQNKTNVAAGAAGIVLTVPEATALIYGQVTDNLGNPQPALAVGDSDDNLYESDVYTDMNGNYVLGAVGLGANDYWEADANDENQITNYVYSEETNYNLSSISAGQALPQNFTAVLATNFITGWLRDNHGNPIAGVEIYDYNETPINGLYFQSGNDGVTDSNGNYVLNVCNGTWDVSVDSYGGDESLPGNYLAPPDQTAVISNNQAVVNFTATLPPFLVTTTALPNGTNGAAYSQTLAATGGQPPYGWTNISGALPPGLTLTSNGVISGTPTNNGTNYFTVEVTDARSDTGTQALALTVVGPPSVIWLQPANGLAAVPAGSNVSLTVGVTGGGPYSYQWQLNGTDLTDGLISTVAGGYLGNGVAGTNASLLNPVGVAVDASGNLWIADTGHQLIRKMGTNGFLTTVVGNGTNGYAGDGGPAINASLSNPAGVAVDAAGNLFIADAGNGFIRKVDTNGVITTVAGGGNDYPGNGEAATNVSLSLPSGVAVDAAGNLLIADTYDGLIRRVDHQGIITTVAGNGTWGYSGDGGPATNASLNCPGGVAVDAAGNLYIADGNNSRVRKVGANGIITTFAGGGATNPWEDQGRAATNASLNYPSSVAWDASGNLFIADANDELIFRVDPRGLITTVAGGGSGDLGDGGTAANASLNGPQGVAVDASGNLFVADTGDNRIRQVSPNGVISTAAGGWWAMGWRPSTPV